jgi:hypothetical protein
MLQFTAESLIRLAGRELAWRGISGEKIGTLSMVVLPPEECHILVTSSHETIEDWEAQVKDHAIIDPPADTLDDPEAEAVLDLEGELVTLVCVQRGDRCMRLGYSPSQNALVIPDFDGIEEDGHVTG